MMACENCLIGVTQSPEQSAVVHTALSRGTGLEGLQKFLPIHIIGLYGVFLKIHHSVKTENCHYVLQSLYLVSARYLLKDSFIALLPVFSNLPFSSILLSGNMKSSSCPTKLNKYTWNKLNHYHVLTSVDVQCFRHYVLSSTEQFLIKR